MLSKVHNNFIEPKLFTQFACMCVCVCVNIINTRAGMPSCPGKQVKHPTPVHTHTHRGGKARPGQVYEEIFALEANTLGTHNQISCIF